MGITCACQKGESEEETIVKILSSMNLNDIETKSAYSEFSKCINKEGDFLDYFMFKSFLAKIVGDNNYKAAQTTFFENIRKSDGNKVNIKVIGSLIIYLSKGTNYQKIEMLSEHYETFYRHFDETSVKSFLSDLVDANTNNCLFAFREQLGKEGIESLVDIWKKVSKRKLVNHVLENYEGIRTKHCLSYKSPKPKIHRLNQSMDMEFEIDGNPNNKDPNMVITFKNNMKEDICEYYEKYNKSQADQFFSSSGFNFNSKTLNVEQQAIKDFIELSFAQLSGEYIRAWLYEDYLKEKTYENICI